MKKRPLPSGAFSRRILDRLLLLGKLPMDEGLAGGITDLLRKTKAESIVDLGASIGRYVEHLASAGFQARGVDGTPGVYELSSGLVMEADLATRLRLPFKCDWVLSLETGEHIPAEHERAFLWNIKRHAKIGAIVSWAWPGRAGRWHVNTKTPEELVESMASIGFALSQKHTRILRRSCDQKGFRQRVHVFFRETRDGRQRRKSA